MFSFKSKITQKVLLYFLTNKKTAIHVNELARILDVDPSNLQKKLIELKSEGFLKIEREGNLVKYSLNSKYRFLKETEKMFMASYGLPQILRERLSKTEGLKQAYIFGSYAKGGFEADSDVDILLIGKHSSIETKKKIIGLQKQLGREFNIVDITEEELEQKLKDKNAFFTDIVAGEKIKII